MAKTTPMSKRWTGVATAMMLAAMASLLSPGGALAQAGSVGGTIGNNHSVSGGQAQSPPRPNRVPNAGTVARSALPSVIQLTEHSIGGTYSIALRHVGGNAYEGTWNVPIVSRMTVTMNGTSIRIERHDKSNANGRLWNSTYSGTKTANSASGTFTNDWNVSGTWEASW